MRICNAISVNLYLLLLQNSASASSFSFAKTNRPFSSAEGSSSSHRFVQCNGRFPSKLRRRRDVAPLRHFCQRRRCSTTLRRKLQYRQLSLSTRPTLSKPPRSLSSPPPTASSPSSARGLPSFCHSLYFIFTICMIARLLLFCSAVVYSTVFLHLSNAIAIIRSSCRPRGILHHSLQLWPRKWFSS